MPLDYTKKSQSPFCTLGTPSAGVEECRVQRAVTVELGVLKVTLEMS